MISLPKKKEMPYRGVFIHEVAGDAMAPLFIPQHHAVVCMPLRRYQTNGIYLIGGLELYRCERQGRSIHMWRDNPLYQQEYYVSVDRFNRAEIAIVIADICIRDRAAIWFMRHQLDAERHKVAA